MKTSKVLETFEVFTSALSGGKKIYLSFHQKNYSSDNCTGEIRRNEIQNPKNHDLELRKNRKFKR